MSNPKEKFENKIKEIINSFEKKTGLRAGWVDIQRNTPVGFCKKEDNSLTCKIKLKDE